MRIATLGNAAVVHTRRWAEYFRGRGHEVRVLTLQQPPPGFDARLLRVPMLPGALRYPLAVPALRGELAAFRPDLVDAHFVPNYGLMAALAGRRFAMTAWGSDLLVNAHRGFQRARARFVLRRAALVIGDSANLAAAAVALGADPARTHAIPWGVEPARFASPPPREPGLLFGARMHEPVYDIPALIRGARPVLERRPHARLVLAGDGPDRAALERLARELLPAGRVTFTGMLGAAGLADWLGRADLYLSASRSDSTSVTLLEAMAAGALPVVSDLEANREWVAEGDGARLFAPGDVDGVTRALERALDDPAWAAAARARNQRVIAERAVWATNMARIEALFESLAGGRA